jgi:hypothetical protein
MAKITGNERILKDVEGLKTDIAKVHVKLAQATDETQIRSFLSVIDRKKANIRRLLGQLQ